METVVTSIRIEKSRFKELNQHAKKLDMSRNEYIDKAIEALNKKLDNEDWERQVAAESLKLKADKEYKKIMQDFDSTLADGLEDEENNGWWK